MKNWQQIGDVAREVVNKLAADAKTRRAISELINYLERDERRDYQSRPESERHRHIYRSVEIVRDWLNGGTP